MRFYGEGGRGGSGRVGEVSGGGSKEDDGWVVAKAAKGVGRERNREAAM